MFKNHPVMLQIKIHQLVKLTLEFSPLQARIVQVKNETEEVEVVELLVQAQIVQIELTGCFLHLENRALTVQVLASEESILRREMVHQTVSNFRKFSIHYSLY